MNTIMGIQLINGVDLIGSLEKQSSYFIIKDPVQVGMVPTQSNQTSIALMPWIPYSDSRMFTIKSEMVVTEFTPAVELINKYNSLFGSGIQIASASALK